jgi:hypothetical protein
MSAYQMWAWLAKDRYLTEHQKPFVSAKHQKYQVGFLGVLRTGLHTYSRLHDART